MGYLILFLVLMIGYILGMLTMACLTMAHRESAQENHEIQEGVYDGGRIS